MMWLQIGFLTVCVPTYCVSIIGNILALVALHRNTELRSAFFVYLANIAFADILYMLVSTLNVMEFMLGEWILGDITCRMHYLLLNTVHSTSVVTLAVLSVERYFSICCATVRSRLSTKCFKAICFIWIIALFITSPMGYERNLSADASGHFRCRGQYWSRENSVIYYSILSIILYLIPFLIIVVTHYKIYNFLRIKIVHVLELKICDSRVATVQSSITNQSKSTIDWKLRQHKRNRKVFKTLFTITLFFFIALFPHIVTRFLHYANVPFPVAIIQVSHLLMYLLPLVNFLIFINTITQLRKKIKTFIPTCIRP